jgi:hypothetical protein
MDLDKINKFRQQQADEKKRIEDMDAIKNVSNSVNKSTENTASTLKSVTKDIAKSSDIDEVIKQLKESQLASYLSAGQKSQIIMADSTDLGEAVLSLGDKLDALAESLKEEKTDAQLIDTVRSELAKVVEALNKDTDTEIINAIQDLKSSFSGIEVNPVVNVPEPVINVDIPKIDFSKLSTDIKAVTAAVKAIKQPNFNIENLLTATNKVSEAVNGLSFPVPNYVLPFRDSDGAATQTDMVPLGTQLVAANKALVTNAVIHGLTTGGGGGYVDVKVNPSGALTVEADVTNTVLATPVAVKFDNSTDPIAYKGEATAGTLASAASWRISRITSQANGSVDIVWADGDTDFNNIWNNRASLSYS